MCLTKMTILKCKLSCLLAIETAVNVFNAILVGEKRRKRFWICDTPSTSRKTGWNYRCFQTLNYFYGIGYYSCDGNITTMCLFSYLGVSVDSYKIIRCPGPQFTFLYIKNSICRISCPAKAVFKVENRIISWEVNYSIILARNFRVNNIHEKIIFNFFMCILSISNHTEFLGQFGINLHLWAFWRTHSRKLIPNWTRNRMITILIYDFTCEILPWQRLASKRPMIVGVICHLLYYKVNKWYT